ncbi:MAG: DUF1292 domain-containing protein [Erysipelothrix sp.]|nr:DUF1292 domain-containing protein [Erysipelothrix sp.]
MLEENKIVVVDENEKEIEMEILFTFENDEFKRKYVLYVNPEDETGEVFVSVYTDEGELLEISDEKEWEMIEEVFEAFVIEHEEA